jgi:hypothetical protein
VGFFSDVEPPEDAYREPEPRRVRWRGDPDDTAGVPIPQRPLLIQNEQVAIIASGFFAYPAGFTFSVVTLSRLSPAPPQFGSHPLGARSRGGPRGGELRFGLGFADGSKALSSQYPVSPSGEISLRMLRSRGGGGGGRKWQQEFWCEPLPPMGSMAFVCEWRDCGVPETSIDVDATAFLDAASQATTLWPEDVDLPEDDDTPLRRPKLWTVSPFRGTQP